VSHTETLTRVADLIKLQRERNPSPSYELHLGARTADKLEAAIRETLEANAKLREAVEALSKELTTEAQGMMRQPEAGVIRSIAERLHAVVFRRKWRDKP
jgi:hypothetical protein